MFEKLFGTPIPEDGSAQTGLNVIGHKSLHCLGGGGGVTFLPKLPAT